MAPECESEYSDYILVSVIWVQLCLWVKKSTSCSKAYI